MAHILLAEDDKSMLNFLMVALQRAGHSIVARANGEEALKALEEDASFELVLTDIVMPGIDGLELAQKIRKKHPNIKIMFITGFAAMALEDQEKIKGMKPQILSKPFHLNDLVDRIDKILAT